MLHFSDQEVVLAPATALRVRVPRAYPKEREEYPVRSGSVRADRAETAQASGESRRNRLCRARQGFQSSQVESRNGVLDRFPPLVDNRFQRPPSANTTPFLREPCLGDRGVQRSKPCLGA